MAKHRSQKGTLFVISGPSGTGKGTVCKELLKENDLKLSVSMTTRQPREGEQNGRDYFFVTREEFEKNIAEGNLLEYADVFGNLYGRMRWSGSWSEEETCFWKSMSRGR